MSQNSRWLAPRQRLSPKARTLLAVLSFLIPLGIWSAVSYVPWIWHPQVKIFTAPEGSTLASGDRVDRQVFDDENKGLLAQGLTPLTGEPANPIFLPAPHEVVTAFYTAFTTPPRRSSDPWLHEALFHSISVIFWGFLWSAFFGIPLGILAGTYTGARRLLEPFIEFFRYLPAPAFGALMVAVLGINDEPKIAIIFIGTFFQMVLVVANTTGKLDPTLLEAAQTLGVKNFGLLFKVVVPGVLPDVFRDQRILLGWAWTYLIVAEVVGTSTGITWFINQQAKYRIYENVFAAIAMIGIVGLVMDQILAALGKVLFRWHRIHSKEVS